MLEIMRKALKGWAGKLLLVLFTLPFLLLGAEQFFTVFTQQEGAIEVNGETISVQQVTNAVESNKERLRQRFGEDFDMSVFSDDALREGAENQLIEAELSKQYAQDNNLRASFSKVSETIREIPNFMGEDGVFSQDVFETIAAQQGISTKQIIEIVREDLSLNQMRTAVSQSEFALEQEVRLKENLNAQTRDIAFVTLELDTFVEMVDVEDAEAEQYYADNLEDYMTDESVRIEYIEIQALPEDIEISDDEIKQRFEEEQLAASENARRKSSHILISIGEEHSEEEAFEIISEVESKLDAGEAFSELAKTYSEDPGTANVGGDLGFAGRGDFAPEFEEALYSLKTGETSAPVLTEFGYHLIKLTEIDKVEALVFEEERSRIERALQQAAAREAYQNTISMVEEVIYESPNLDEAATKTGLEIQVSDFFTRDAGEGIAAKTEIRDLAFSDTVLLDKMNSSVVEIENGKAVAIHLNEYRPSEKIPFADVSNEIIEKLKISKAETMLSERKDALLEKLRSNEEISAEIDELNLDWESVQGMGRRYNKIPPQLVSKAFEMPRPAEETFTVDSVEIADGAAIIRLDSVNDSELDINSKRMTALKVRDSRNGGNDAWMQFVEFMKADSEILYFAN